MQNPIIATACLLALVVLETAAGQTRTRYVIKRLDMPGQSSNRMDQFSQDFLKAVQDRLNKNSDPNFEVFLEGDKRIEPCLEPFDTCDLVNLAREVNQLRAPLQVNGSPDKKHGKVHQQTCTAESRCWDEAIAAAAACIRAHHEVVHLGRPARNPRSCNVVFRHGGSQ